MPLSSVVGAQSIVKPGVCTSSTKPASPFDGQMIYMTDVDQSAVWDGSAWVGLDPSRDRNVVINGAMQVAQRGTSVASLGSGVDDYHTADRWRLLNATASPTPTVTISVENDAPTGSGLRKSLKVLVTTAAASPAAATVLSVESRMEGQNLQGFAKGTASAKQLTLSFWVKSNVTGTYIAELYDADNDRICCQSYSVSASATWERKTIVFPADASGVLDNDNAWSLGLKFYLAAGTNHTSGTLATTWASRTNTNRAVGQTNLASAINNYWQVTGVQLEAGAVATPFEFEDYGTTLAKCQRYYWRIANKTGASDLLIQNGVYNSTTRIHVAMPLPVQMRAVPTLNATSATNSYYIAGASTDYFNSFTVSGDSTNNAVLLFNNTEVSGTAGYAGTAQLTASNGYIDLSAEL